MTNHQQGGEGMEPQPAQESIFLALHQLMNQLQHIQPKYRLAQRADKPTHGSNLPLEDVLGAIAQWMTILEHQLTDIESEVSAHLAFQREVGSNEETDCSC